MYREYKPYGIIFFLTTIFLLSTMGMARAETFCVNTAQELHDALTGAQSNGQDDIIRIVQGTYNGNFIYASTEEYSVTVEGGYATGCSSRTINAENTVLDGGGSGPVLVLSSSEVSAYKVEGITLRNGSVTDRGGSGIYANTHGNVELSNNVFDNNHSISPYRYSLDITFAPVVNLNNNAIMNSSGGVDIVGATAVNLSNNTIFNNDGDQGGGGFV
jgi:hypothetical protein